MLLWNTQKQIWQCFQYLFPKYKRIWNAMGFFESRPKQKKKKLPPDGLDWLFYLAGSSKSHYDIPISFIFLQSFPSNPYEKTLPNHGKNFQVFHDTINLMWTAFPWKPWKKQFDDFFFSFSPLVATMVFSRWLWRWTVFTRKDGWDLEVSPSWPPPKPFSEAPRPLTGKFNQELLYFKKFEFTRQKKRCAFFAIWTENVRR